MLFRKSLRVQFVLLITGFSLLMGLSTINYFKDYRDIGIKKQEILNEPSFKFFFLYSLEKETYSDLLKDKEIAPLVMADVFVHMDNIYISFDLQPTNKPLQQMYEMLGISNIVKDFFPNEAKKYKVKTEYIDYNGKYLSDSLRQGRRKKLFKVIEERLIDYSLRDNIAIPTVERVFNDMYPRIFKGIREIKYQDNTNTFLSRINHIIPVNIFRPFVYMSILDGTEIRKYKPKIVSETDKVVFVELNEKIYKNYQDKIKGIEENMFTNWFMRYTPIYKPDFIYAKNLFEHPFFDMILNVKGLETDSLKDKLHDYNSKGHYLFSYEKLAFIEKEVKEINQRLKKNIIRFFWYDFFIGLIFCYSISLFSYIYLKKEIAFLIFHKNAIRQILSVFYLIPIIAFISIKIACYLLVYGFNPAIGFPIAILGITLILIALVFLIFHIMCYHNVLNKDLKLINLFKGK
jgi:hypothetical protein